MILSEIYVVFGYFVMSFYFYLIITETLNLLSQSV